ncbi:MAG: glycoside hydrolase family 16 protein [Propionibacteriaceae bacterium]|nr:glycoside hydrolase family 16 protein [Propionibacteriaceae bacterium]
MLTAIWARFPERMIRMLGGVRRGAISLVVALGLTAMSLLGGATAVAATRAALLDTVPAAAKSTLQYDLAAYGPNGGFRATFASPHKFTGRVVSLQKQTGSGWSEVAKVKMTSKGVAVFKVAPAANVSYRAVADTFKRTVKKKKVTESPVTTRTVTVPAPAKTYNFGSLESDWSYRKTGEFDAGGRLCAAPSDKNVSFTGGKAVLKVTKVTDKKLIEQVTAAAKAAQKKAKQKQVGCPHGVYYNAMLSTAGAFTAKSGTLSARVKFPLGQGMHAGVWLQSGADSELDVVESYGYGKYITSGIHLKGDKAKQPVKYVLKKPIKTKSWWTKYHTVSVKWDRATVSMWVDGTKVQEVKKAKPDTQYYIVLSLLTSDWETSGMTKPKKGAKGVKKTVLSTSKFYVDWLKYWEQV